LLQSCCEHQLAALHWYEQIAPVFTAFFSTAQAPGGSFIACFIALAEADGTLHGMLVANTNASVTNRIFANDMMRIRFPLKFLAAIILAY
jgi:hypothetical protein